MTPLALLTYPNIDPIAIEFGPISIKWYGLAYMTGLVLGWLYIRRLISTPKLWLGDKPPLTLERVDDLLLYMTFAVIIGGRLGQVLLYDPDFYFANPAEIVKVWKGGMSFHGALHRLADLLILLFARQLQGFRQIGHGPLLRGGAVRHLLRPHRELHQLGALGPRHRLPRSAWCSRTAAPEPRHPSQLYEAVLEGLVMFVIMRFATHRMLALKRPGLVTGIWLIWYAIARSICEIFREPEARSHSQHRTIHGGTGLLSADAAARPLYGLGGMPIGGIRKGAA